MVLTFAACGQTKKKTAEEVYAEAVAKNAALTSTQADMTMDIDMDMGGMSLGMKMDMVMKMKKADDKYEMAMTGGTTVMGQSIDMAVYYKDGYTYTNAMGTKVKQATPLEEIAKQAESMTMESAPVDYLENLAMTEADGVTTLTYDISQDKMKEYFDEAMKATGESTIPEGTEMTFESMSGTATVNKDGYITAETVDMVFSMVMEGQEVKCTAKVDMTYVDPGQDFAIEFPEDLDTYTEVPAVTGSKGDETPKDDVTNPDTDPDASEPEASSSVPTPDGAPEGDASSSTPENAPESNPESTPEESSSKAA